MGEKQTATLNFTGMFRNVEDIANPAAISVVDGYIDDNKYFNKRPALTAITTTGASLGTSNIVGLYYWSVKNLVLVVTGGHLFTIDSSNVVTDRGSGFETNQRAYFATARTGGVEVVVIANGGDMLSYNHDTLTLTNIYSVDPDAPRFVNQVHFLDGYLLALPANSKKFFFSAVLDCLDWDPLDFAEAESKADNINSMVVNNGRIYLFGEQSTEIFYNNGIAPFIRQDGAQLEVGCSAPDSVCLVEGSIFLLDTNRRVIRMSEGSYEVVSNSMNKLLQNLSSITDAYFLPIYVNGKLFIQLTFPTATRGSFDGSNYTGISFVYDVLNSFYYSWSQWQTVSAEYANFPVFCQTYAVARRTLLLGSSLPNGKIYNLNGDAYVDDGNVAIRSEYITSFIDFGNLYRKRLEGLQLRMTSGTPILPTTVMFNIRKDGNSEFETAREQSLQVGTTVINQSILGINCLGICRNFSMVFSSTTDSPLCLGNLEISYEQMVR